MENINIKINKLTRQVNLSKSVIGNDGENLQEKLIFEFDEFVNGTARLELIKQGETASYVMLTKVNETYELPVRSIITKAGKLNMQLVITEGTDDEEIPIFKSNKFYLVCNSSLNALIEQPEEYPQWIDVANAKLNEIDEAISNAGNLDVDVSKEGTIATVTITHQDETQESVEILDGEKGDKGDDATINGVKTLNIKAGMNIIIEQENNDLTINATSGGVGSVNGKTGIVVLTTNDLENDSGYITKDVDDLTNYYKKTETYTQSEIDTKLTAVYKYKGTVSTYADLPSTGLTIGDVYNVESDGSNYAWTGTEWDKLGGTVDLSDYYTKQQTYSQAEVNALIPNLTDYVKNTDYPATDGTTSGVLRVNTAFATTRDGSGNLYTQTKTYALYNDASNNMFIGKGTLENVITGKGLVSNTIIKNAQSTTAGDVYDVRYINSLIGDIGTALDLINGESVGA